MFTLKVKGTILFLILLICVQVPSLAASNMKPSTNTQVLALSAINKTEAIQTMKDNTIGLADKNSVSAMSMTVVRDDQIVSELYHGQDVMGHNVTANSSYWINSATKPFTATAALIADEQGRLNLDADISQYLPFVYSDPYYPNAKTTMRELLAFRSGMTAFFDRPSYQDTYYSVFYGWNQSSYVDSSCSTLQYLNVTYPNSVIQFFSPTGKYYSQQIWSPDRKPGKDDTQIDWSEFSYTLAGYIIEQVANQTMQQFMDEQVFNKIGATHTKYLLSDLAVNDTMWGQPPKCNDFITYFQDRGAYGLWSSSNDIAKFLLIHMNQGIYEGQYILNSTDVALMQTMSYTAHSNNPIYKTDWGLGWLLPHTVYQDGWVGYSSPFYGYDTEMWMKTIGNHTYGYVVLSAGGAAFLTEPVRTAIEAGYFNPDNATSISTDTNTDGGHPTSNRTPIFSYFEIYLLLTACAIKLVRKYKINKKVEMN